MSTELARLEERVAELEEALRIVDRIEETERLAYTLTCAAFALGISKRTLRRQIVAGNITPLEGHKLIDRDELIRWIKTRTQRAAESRATIFAPRPRAKRVRALNPEFTQQQQATG